VEALHGSSTLYVGNLSFFTSELQIQETFSRVGPVKRIIMGLNRESLTPCGFCFVEYFTHEHARECLKFISGTMCDDRVIRCELDGGFKQGRQFGRGASGGQIRDERRADIDLGRGGVVTKDSAPRKRRDLSRTTVESGEKDLFGRDKERGGRVPDLSAALPSSRREPSTSTAPAVDTQAAADEAQSRGREEEDEDESDRPRKNPRFREVDEDDDRENED
jgi:nuclear cap-binding protein subunit 2